MLTWLKSWLAAQRPLALRQEGWRWVASFAIYGGEPFPTWDITNPHGHTWVVLLSQYRGRDGIWIVSSN